MSKHASYIFLLASGVILPRVLFHLWPVSVSLPQIITAKWNQISRLSTRLEINGGLEQLYVRARCLQVCLHIHGVLLLPSATFTCRAGRNCFWCEFVFAGFPYFCRSILISCQIVWCCLSVFAKESCAKKTECLGRHWLIVSKFRQIICHRPKQANTSFRCCLHPNTDGFRSLALEHHLIVGLSKAIRCNWFNRF